MTREPADNFVSIRVNQVSRDAHVMETTSTSRDLEQAGFALRRPWLRTKKDRSDRRGGKACCGPPATLSRAARTDITTPRVTCKRFREKGLRNTCLKNYVGPPTTVTRAAEPTGGKDMGRHSGAPIFRAPRRGRARGRARSGPGAGPAPGSRRPRLQSPEGIQARSPRARSSARGRAVARADRLR